MTVQRVRYGRIRDLTQQLLSRFAVDTPPVPVERILIGIGAEIRYGDLGEVSGLVARRDGKAIIGVNSTHVGTRQRFTLAHECGHFLLHQDLTSHTDTSFRVKYRDRKSSEATDIEEIEANFFAAALLMPRRFLDKLDAAEALGDDELVSTLAKVFAVSSHAISQPLENEYSHQRPF